MRVYLDNAASTPLSPDVLAAMMPYLAEQYGNPSSIHYHGRRLRTAIEDARKTIAQVLDCAPAEVVFTSGGTEADNTILQGAVRCGAVTRIVTSAVEHHAVLHTVEALQNLYPDLRLSLVELDDHGRAQPDHLADILADGVPTLVSLIHGNNETGALNNLEALGAICRQHGALFHSDTVQTIGLLPFRLCQQPVDYVVASAHKFYGPRGVGFYYRNPSAPCPPLLMGGGQERNQRAGTEDVAAIVGCAVALKLAAEHRDAHRKHLQTLKQAMMDGLRERIPGVGFNAGSDSPESLPTVLSVHFPLQDEESLLLYNLDIEQISASGGSACASGSLHPSHVLQALGYDRCHAANSVRFSFGSQNTLEEVHHVVAKLADIVVPQMAM